MGKKGIRISNMLNSRWASKKRCGVGSWIYESGFQDTELQI